MEKQDFVRWLVEGLTDTGGDPGPLEAYVREGARRFGEIDKAWFRLLPTSMARAYSEEVRGY